MKRLQPIQSLRFSLALRWCVVLMLQCLSATETEAPAMFCTQPCPLTPNSIPRGAFLPPFLPRTAAVWWAVRARSSGTIAPLWRGGLHLQPQGRGSLAEMTDLHMTHCSCGCECYPRPRQARETCMGSSPLWGMFHVVAVANAFFSCVKENTQYVCCLKLVGCDICYSYYSWTV